jgi:integrase
MERPTASPAARRAGYVTASLAAFCAAQGLGDASLCRELVEAYCAIGLSARTTSTRGTYRAVLRATAEHLERRPAVAYPGAPAPAPYSPDERAALFATAAAQPRPWLCQAARVLLCFGIGAGLRPGELARLRGGDVEARDGAVVVSAAGRSVAVAQPCAAEAAALARAAGPAHLFHPGEAARAYKNFVNDACRKLVRDPAAPVLSAWRCRSSFICDHLSAGTPLVVLAAEAGLASVCSLRRHARHVAGVPTTNAGLARRAAEELAAR